MKQRFSSFNEADIHFEKISSFNEAEIRFNPFLFEVLTFVNTLKLWSAVVGEMTNKSKKFPY